MGMYFWIASAALFLAGSAGSDAVCPEHATPAFSFERLDEEAAALAARPFSPPATALPPAMAQVTYEQYLNIRPDMRRALWRDAGTPFRAAFYPRAYIYHQRVEIHEIAGGRTAPVPSSKDLFNWGSPEIEGRAPEDLGFAGLRILFPLDRPDHLDELISFLGASYFRALGRGQVYGASARGLALDTGIGPGEEFPSFRKFWIERPARGDRALTLHALLDGPGATGAYRFTVEPGDDTTVEVQATLRLRRPVEVLGLAPITSMFLYGEDRRGSPGDPRPEVHDSDGLLLAGSPGTWTWRPLENPPHPRLSRFPLPRGAGFGLCQRDRDADHYRDTGANYEKRPGIWVEPLDPWPEGSVVLLELPAKGEWQDNIACFFQPAAPVPPGTAYPVRYRLHFRLRPPCAGRLARVVSTRRESRPQGAARFSIEFAGPALAGLDPGDGVEASISAAGGEVASTAVEELPGRSRRLSFDVRSAGGAAAELRAGLHRGGTALTETWSFPWSP